MSDTFVHAVRMGRAHWTDIDDWVDRWHESTSSQTLPDYLGLSEDDYALWVERPQALRLILLAHEQGVQVAALLADTSPHAVAARRLDPATEDEVREWLRQTGRLPD